MSPKFPKSLSLDKEEKGKPKVLPGRGILAGGTHLCAGSSLNGRREHPLPWSSRSCRTSDCRRKWCLHLALSGMTVGKRSAWTGCLRPLTGIFPHRFSQHHRALSRYQMEQAWTSCQRSFDLPLQHTEEINPGRPKAMHARS